MIPQRAIAQLEQELIGTAGGVSCISVGEQEPERLSKLGRRPSPRQVVRDEQQRAPAEHPLAYGLDFVRIKR